MLEELKEQVYKENLELPKRGLVTYTWGNVSAIDANRELVVIKPSGVDYETMRPENMVVVDMQGRVVEGQLRPSSDLATHLELYKGFKAIGGVVHTHSSWAASWAQACRPIPALGTTHADYFYGPVPCTRPLTKEEVEEGYEVNTGRVICSVLTDQQVKAVPAIIVANHGPFTWGKDAAEAVYHAVVLEEVAKMAFHTLQLNPQVAMPAYVLDKHYMRKHGPKAYYGQK